MIVSASRTVKVVASLLTLVIVVSAPASANVQENYFGKQIYDWLYSSGIIISKSPLYNDVLNPITEPLKTVAQPKYDAPLVFTIGRDPYPNVAAVPGGRFYVSDKAFAVIKYREELAGALCHAVAHTVRHDFASVARKAFNTQMAAGLLMLGASGAYYGTILNNPLKLLDGKTLNHIVASTSPGNVAAVNAAGSAVRDGSVSPLTAAEEVEADADMAGADLCAAAGLNPWGLVWLFEHYQKSKMAGRMEMLPAAPAARIRNLQAYLESAPEKFGSFDKDRAHGTPMR